MTVVIPVFVSLLLLNAFLSAASSALFSVGGSRLRTLREEGFQGAKELSEIRSRAGEVQNLLSLLGTLISLLAVGLLTGFMALERGLPGLLVTLFATGFGFLLVGEVLPRSLAIRRSVRFALAVAPTIQRLERFFRPLFRPILRIQGSLSRLGGENGATPEEREVREITELGQEEGIVGLEEHALVERAFRLDELTAWDVMTPRVAIFAWKDDLTLDDVVGELERLPYSRVPVYGESVDDITGVLHVRDIYVNFSLGRGEATLKSFAREPFFVPGSVSLARLLKDFQARRLHLGIVADEFGGTDGLVTLEDVLEELVGEIEDETDLPEEPLVRISKTEIIADGALDIREINYAFNVSLPQLESRSLNGFIIEELGYVPERGETLERHRVRIDVVDATDTQVLRARVRKLLPQESTQED
jgi:CBS domain containing-hemolysin-like protein